MRRVRRAVVVAKGDGWSVGVFGGLSFLLGLGSWPAMLLGAAMIGAAVVELHGAARLRSLQIGAARRLGFNQIGLTATLSLYALWSIHLELTGQGALAGAAADPQLAEILGSVKDLAQQLAMVVYGGLIVVAVFGQGGLAWYYFTREKYVRRYLESTPTWIISMQHAGVTL